MNKRGGLALTGLALGWLLVAGCATGPTRLDQAYGTSYQFAKLSQTLWAKDATTPTKLQTLDGQAAKHMLDRYRSTFEKPPPPPTFAISVGGIK